MINKITHCPLCQNNIQWSIPNYLGIVKGITYCSENLRINERSVEADFHIFIPFGGQYTHYVFSLGKGNIYPRIIIPNIGYEAGDVSLEMNNSGYKKILIEKIDIIDDAKVQEIFSILEAYELFK